MISEVRIGTLSVADLAVALRFYGHGLGYELRARGPLAAELAGPWRIPSRIAIFARSRKSIAAFSVVNVFVTFCPASSRITTR